MKKSDIIIVSVGVLIALMLVSFSTFAQNWTSTGGPFRPHAVFDLTAAKVGSVQTIYAADDTMLMMTTNGGTYWLNTNSIIRNPIVVAVKPDDANIVHVAKATKLYRSIDGGSTWGIPKIDDPDLVPLRLNVSTNIWLLGTDTVLRQSQWKTSLYRSGDGGTNWSEVSYFRTTDHTNMNDICFKPSNPSNIWVGGSHSPLGKDPDMGYEYTNPYTKGVWYSADYGATWSFRGTMGGGTDRNVSALAYSNSPSNDLFFAATTKLDGSTVKAIVYQSGDGGQTWALTANLYDQLQISLVRAMKASPTDANVVIAATDKGFAISTNRAINWSLRNNGLDDIQKAYQVMFDKNDLSGNTIYFGTDPTVYKSTDQGQTWSGATGISNLMNVAGLAFNGGIAHAVSGLYSVYSGVAKFSGSAWDPTPRSVGQKQFSGVAAAINFNNTQYANVCGDSAGNGVIYVRTDGADGWRKVFTSNAASTRLNTVRADPKTNPGSQRVYAGGTMYVGGSFANFIRSTNLGVDWSSPTRIGLNDGVPVNSIGIDPSSGTSYSTVLYAGLGTALGSSWGVRKSNDGGSTWPTSQLNGNNILAIAVASSTVLYLSSSNTVWKSTDALGSAPAQLTTPFNTGAKSILMHPSYLSNTDHFWVITSDGQQIYKTADGGNVWTEISTTSLSKPLNDLQRDPASSVMIYIGTPYGVYKIDPAPEPPPVFRISGTNCTPTTCNTLGPLSPGPGSCYPVLSWNANLEADLASSGTYELERKIGSGGAWNLLTATTNLSYTDPAVTLSSDGTYWVYYRARAKDAANNYSDYCTPICVFAKTVPLFFAGRQQNEPNREGVAEFMLHQNSPNPFNPVTMINYSLPKQLPVQLTVYDILGREVATLVKEVQDPGYKTVTFDGKDYPSGIYFYRLMAGTLMEVKKMVLAK